MNAFHVAAVGLQAQKEQLDVLAGNLANVGTPTYKRQSVDFSALLDRAPAGQALGAPAPGAARADRLLRHDAAQGQVHATGRALDVAIRGAGYVEIELPGGGVGFSRAGSLQLDAEGVLTVAGGQPLKADIRVPRGAANLRIDADGNVSALLEGDRASTVLGRIELALLANPEQLAYRGDGVFTLPEGVDGPRRARPGEEGAGTLAAGHLEGSNVRIVDEMLALVLTQRVYELNSRVVQVADELAGMSNNLRRG
jgi:flagellar basal-body rod protein FlgG